MCTITGSDVNHIRNVLRMKIGETDSRQRRGQGGNYFCKIAKLEQKISCRQDISV